MASWSTWCYPTPTARRHGLKRGDVLLAYNGKALNRTDDLKVADDSQKPIDVEVWNDGRVSRRDLAPGKLGIVVDPRPAPVAISENRRMQQAIVGGAVRATNTS